MFLVGSNGSIHIIKQSCVFYQLLITHSVLQFSVIQTKSNYLNIYDNRGPTVNLVAYLYPPEASSRYFGLALATLPHIQKLRSHSKKKATAARFTKFAGYLHFGVSFSRTEISFILKNKMATTDISLKIMYIFLLAVSHR